jgi:hypothetical protein
LEKPLAVVALVALDLEKRVPFSIPVYERRQGFAPAFVFFLGEKISPFQAECFYYRVRVTPGVAME